MLQLNLTRPQSSTPPSSSNRAGCGLDLIDSLATSIEAQLDHLLLMLTNNNNNNNNNKKNKGNNKLGQSNHLGSSSDETETDDELSAPVDAETLRRYVNSLRWCPTGISSTTSSNGGNGHARKPQTNGFGNELMLRHLRQHFRPDVTVAYLALKKADLVGDFCEADVECEELAYSLHFHGADSWRDLIAVIAALSESDRHLRLAVVCFCDEPALLPHLEFLREALLTTGLTRGCRVESMRLSTRPVTAEDLQLAAAFQARDLGQKPPALVGFLSQRSALQASRAVWRELQRLHWRLYVVTAGAAPSALLGQSLRRCGFSDRANGCGLQSWRFVQKRKHQKLQLKRVDEKENVSPKEKLCVLAASVTFLILFAQLFTRPLSFVTLLRSSGFFLAVAFFLAAIYLLHLALNSAFGCLEANLERCVRQGRFEWQRCRVRIGPAIRVLAPLISTVRSIIGGSKAQHLQLRRR